MRQVDASLERVVGRNTEVCQLHAALRERQSQLILGALDSGKTFLIARVLAELPKNEREKCICWAGPATRRQLVEHLVRELFLTGDPFVRKKAQADRGDEGTLGHWIIAQSALRLRGILFTAGPGDQDAEVR